MFISLLILGLLVFRWKLLMPVLGPIRMEFFDALLFTVLAAMNFAQPAPTYQWVSYIIGGLCIFWAIIAGRKFLMYSEAQRIENGKGKSDS